MMLPCCTCKRPCFAHELTIMFDGRPDGGPWCSACLLRWWRQELLLLLFERAIDEELRTRKALLQEGRALLRRVQDARP